MDARQRHQRAKGAKAAHRSQVLAAMAREHVATLRHALTQLTAVEKLLAGTAVLGKDEPVFRLRLQRLVRLWAHSFVVEQTAWQLFCADLHLASAALIRDLPGHQQVQQAAQRMEPLAYSEAEAFAAARQELGAAQTEWTDDEVYPTWQILRRTEALGTRAAHHGRSASWR